MHFFSPSEASVRKEHLPLYLTHNSMQSTPILIPASDQFWTAAARVFLRVADRFDPAALAQRDFSGIRVVVPTFVHSHLLLQVLSAELGGNVIPPRINTLFALLEMLPPDAGAPRVPSAGERLMDLYSALRQHAWLKKLFSARRNTDLLPLAQTLIDLSDELTRAMLPNLDGKYDTPEQRWHKALAQLSPPAQQMLSDEAQLVWTIWQGQLDANDGNLLRYQRLLEIAESATEPLLWISPTAPDVIEQAFLNAYAESQPVQVLTLDWLASALAHPYSTAWSQLADASDAFAAELEPSSLAHLSLIQADSLEDEAQQGAQAIINWLLAGKTKLAVIAQDRAVSRRIRALLERADVLVADETGWKLSTTRAAAALAAWFDVVVTRADTMTLLDLLKSPYLDCPKTESDEGAQSKSDRIMHIEFALRRANVLSGWDSILFSLDRLPDEANWIASIARQAHAYDARRKLSDWASHTLQTLQNLCMHTALDADSAGQQIIKLLQDIQANCQKMEATFSFSEWRSFVNLQMENAPFVVAHADPRVVMLPLNGARLRSFDAVLVVGVDATHLPSQPQETLFFSNAVKRELGLVTREQRHRQQLRDFAELLLSNPEVVMSWQAHQNGEHNPISPWISQLQLALERSGAPLIPVRRIAIAEHRLPVMRSEKPRPSAPELRPAHLSSSGFTSLMACPYQFFAGRMLGLNALDELSDMPEKRDYGDWLHAILHRFHTALLAQPAADKLDLLTEVSNELFDKVLQHSPAALGFSVRWRKVMPAYVAWVEKHQDEGWQFAFGEEKKERVLVWEDGSAKDQTDQQITLRGRIDRIDQNANGEYAVLDYKTTTTTILKKRLASGEDHQLPFYALMLDTLPTTASYVGLEAVKNKIDEVVADELAERTHALENAITSNMQAITDNAALPAQGTESVCQYCDMRGLCRKGAW
jgi:ATP-dependent helicase/nuclease subunit B